MNFEIKIFYHIAKVVGFFDFSPLLWDVKQLEFKDENCFKPIKCQRSNLDEKYIECEYNFYQKRESCGDIFETKIKLGKNWHKTQLPVNRYVPKVYQSAKSESNDVFLSSCVDDIAVVIEDLDGLGASVKVPTVRHV